MRYDACLQGTAGTGEGGNAVKKRNPFRSLIGVLCVLLFVFAVAVAVYLDSQSPNPILGILWNDPTEQTENKTPNGDGPVTPPTDLPATVIIPTEKDGLKFPCDVPEYGLVIEKLAPYHGLYVEDGTNVELEEVAMLLVYNAEGFPVEYTQISIAYGEETLLFDISALPVGERLVVQEKTGKPVPEGKPISAKATVVQRADMEMSESQVRVTDNGDNTLTIQNLTDEQIPTVRVFYKYYMEEEGIFVGGIAFTVRVTRLGAGASVTVQPAHYNSQTSRVVMVLTYDSEV